MGFNKIFVLGEPKYYCRFDFGLAKEFNYFCEYDPEGDYFMVQGELSIEPKRTTVSYCK
jgi:predicted N-acetyltransferase YhbS